MENTKISTPEFSSASNEIKSAEITDMAVRVNPYELINNRGLSGDYIRQDEVVKLIWDAVQVGIRQEQQNAQFAKREGGLENSLVEKANTLTHLSKYQRQLYIEGGEYVLKLIKSLNNN